MKESKNPEEGTSFQRMTDILNLNSFELNENEKKEWPNPDDNNDKIFIDNYNLRQFYYETDHKFNSRIVCTVCYRFYYTDEEISFIKK